MIDIDDRAAGCAWIFKVDIDRGDGCILGDQDRLRGARDDSQAPLDLEERAGRSAASDLDPNGRTLETGGLPVFNADPGIPIRLIDPDIRFFISR